MSKFGAFDQTTGICPPLSGYGGAAANLPFPPDPAKQFS